MQRLNKYLVFHGLADSRRKADEYIKNNFVSINGKVINDFSYKVNTSDRVALNHKLAEERSSIYLAFYKPKGFVCTHNPQGNNRSIFDILPKKFKNLKFAGRLDKDSEGLIILTNDGDFVYKLTHPSNNKSKKYLVSANPKVDDSLVDALNSGVALKDGLSKLKTKRHGVNSVVIEMKEGRNRQIRRTFDTLGFKVTMLRRISIGKYSNSNLKAKDYEFIKPGDVV